MHRALTATLGVACSLLFAHEVPAAGEGLTRDDVLAIARERAPILLAARARVEEEKGALAAGSALLRDNPILEAAAGPRRGGGGGESTDVDIEISQAFELGGQRAARIAGAEAEIRHATARAENATRRLLGDVAAAFCRGLAAEERLRLASRAERLAADLGRSAERRYGSGDVSVLERNLARTTMARTSSEMRAAEAEVAASLGELRALLGLTADEPLRLRGDLHERRHYDVEALLTDSTTRADLRQLAAAVEEAEAEARLGAGSAWPDVALGFRYGRDQGANITMGGLTIALPVFARGQAEQITGLSRARRLRQELEARRLAVDVEVRTAFDVYRHRLQAVEELERDLLPRLDENDALGRRGYDAGELGLVDLLLILRDGLDARVAYQERLLEAALAGVELEAEAGVLR